MKISIVADELSNDPETAFEIGLEWGIDLFELRGVFDRRVPRIEPHVRRRLIRTVRDFGVSITAVSPGLFKMPLPATPPRRSNLGWMNRQFDLAWSEAHRLVADHIDRLLPETADFACEVGAETIIAFSFERGGVGTNDAPPAVVEAIVRATEVAARSGLVIAIETEEGHWANTGRRTAQLVERAGAGNVGVNWDPANALIDGDLPWPDGYQAVRAHLLNVHFKDVKIDAGGSWRIVDCGSVPWEEQISSLVRDNYAGAIAIEPHLSPSIASCKRSLERLRRLISSASKAA